MEGLAAQAAALKESWKRVYATIRTNPAAYQAYLPGANAEQLNEVVETIISWFTRVRRPKGFAPVYHVARSLAGTALTSAAAASEALARGEYAHFPAFVQSLTQVLTSMHTMLAFGDRSEAATALADLGTSLAESLSLVETAQRELASKAQELRTADESLELATLAAEESTASATQAKSALEELAKSALAAEADRTHIEELLAEAEKTSATLEDHAGVAAKLIEQVNKAKEDLAGLMTKAQQHDELITALLPKGASAGLASAFALRVGQLEKTKWIWMAGFVTSILGLVGLAAWILYDTASSNDQLWLQILQRIPLAAPLVWSGWFSAVQYGNTLRVQEDYAFKEATAKAFAGFHDHLEHMAAVAEKDGASAMANLYNKTIEALAREPLRIFQGPDKDAAPSQALLDALKNRVS